MEKTIEQLDKKPEEERKLSPMNKGESLGFGDLARNFRTQTQHNLKGHMSQNLMGGPSAVIPHQTNTHDSLLKSQSFIDDGKDARAVFRQKQLDAFSEANPLPKLRMQQQSELLDKKVAPGERVQRALSLIHGKIIKFEKGTVSFKPIATANKICDAMGRMDEDQLTILLKFLRSLAQEFASQPPDSINSKNPMVHNLAGSVQAIIACCYAKLVLLLPTILDENCNQQYFAKIQDGISLLCDFFNYFVIKVPGRVRKDALEIMLGFSLIATDIMFFPTKEVKNKKFREVVDPIEMRYKQTTLQNVSVGGIMFSVLSLCAGLVPVHLLYASPDLNEAYDEENQALVVKVLIQMLQISSQLEEIFFGEIFFLNERHFMQKNVGVFREFLELPALGIVYEETSLLNLLIQVAFRALRCWKNRIPKRAPGTPLTEMKKQASALRLEHIAEFEAYYKDLLTFLDKIHIMQVRYYLKTETLSEAQLGAAFEAERERLEAKTPEEQPSRDKNSPKTFPKMIKHLSKESLGDKDSYVQGSCRINGEQLAAQLNHQENWIRVNMALFKLGALLQPNYFLHFGWQAEGCSSGQNSKQNKNIQRYNKKDFLSHMCDLMRIHIYFIMRFDLYAHQYNKPLKKLRDINELYIAYDCNLVKTMQMFSQLFCDTENIQYNLQAQLQFQAFLTLLIDTEYQESLGQVKGVRVYAPVDKKHFLRIWYLLFALVGPTLPSENSDQQGGKKSYMFKGGVIDRVFYFDCLHSFIKAHFYREKNLKLYEETYDVEDYEDIEKLMTIIAQQLLSSKAQEMSEEQRKAEALTQINKVLVQRLALQRLVDIAQTDSYIYEKCWNVIHAEISQHKQKEKLLGNLYQDNTQEILVDGKKQKVVERICSGSYLNKLYQYVKLAVYLLVQYPYEYDFSTAHAILIGPSPELERHSSFGDSPVQRNVEGRSRTMPAVVEASDPPDILIKYSASFQTHPFFRILSLRDLWALLIEWIKNMSAVLTEQQNQSHRRIGGNQRQSQPSAMTKSKAGPSRPPGNENRSFDFLDKVNNLLKRFFVYCSQSHIVCDQIAYDMQQAHRSVQNGSMSGLEPQAAQFSISGANTSLQQITSNFKEIKDNEFKLLVLRNICFQLDPNNEEAGQNFEVVFAMLKFTLGSCKAKFDSLISQEKEYSKKFEQGKAEGAGVKHKVIELREKFFEKMLSEYRRQAEVALSIIKIYTNEICQDSVTLDLLEMQKFHQSVLKSLKTFIMAEGSFVRELVLESLNVYHFSIRESSDPFQIGPEIIEEKEQDCLEFEEVKLNKAEKKDTYQQKFLNYAFYKFWLDFVLETCLEYKSVSQQQAETSLEFYSPVLIKKFEHVQTQALRTTKEVIKLVRERVDYVDDVFNMDLLKLARSFQFDGIKSIKKLFIYLREEQDSARDHQSGDQCEIIVTYLRKTLAKVFSYLPKAYDFKEFFSFLREIMFYNDQLDEVDQKLAGDMLWVLNRVLGAGCEHLIDPKPLKHMSNLNQQQNRMQDFFHFSRMSQGLLLGNQFRVELEPFICVMFKFEWASVLKDARANGGELAMTLLSFQQHVDKDGQNVMHQDKIYNVQVIVNSKNNTFRVGNAVQKISRGWQFLLFRFKLKKETLNIFSEKVYAEIRFGPQGKNNLKFEDKLDEFDPKGEYYFSLGCSVTHCFGFEKQKSRLSPYNRKRREAESRNRGLSPAQSGDYFRGCISLPLFLESVDNLSEFLREPEVAQAFSDALADLICTKKIINHNGLDLQPFIDERRNQPARRGEGIKPVRYINKKEIKTCDEFTTPIVLIHSKAVQAGHLCAVHSVAPSKIFVSFGGFKNIFPLVEKVAKSNLRDLSVNRTKPGQILKWVFRILNTMLQTEPAHIEAMQNQNELLSIIKHILVRLCKFNMLTVEVIRQFKNLFKENLVVRTYSVSSDPEFDAGHAKSDISIIDSANHSLRQKHKFIEGFLARLFNEIVLCPEIGMLTCHIQRGQHKGDSTTHSEASMMTQPRTTQKFITEVIDLVVDVCCAPQHQRQHRALLQQQSRLQQQFQSTNMDMGQVKTDYLKLQRITVTSEHRTVQRMLEYLQHKEYSSNTPHTVLSHLGECIANSILHLSDTLALVNIRRSIRDKNITPERLKAYLLVILKVMRGVYWWSKDRKKTDKKFLSELDQVTNDPISQIMSSQFIYEDEFEDYQTNDIAQQKDQIIGLCILITVQIAVNTKTKFGKEKGDLDGADKIKLIKKLMDNVEKNHILLNNSYLTLTMLAFRRDELIGRENDVIPCIAEVLEVIKQRDAVRNVQHQSITGNNFDIDFYFLVLRNFYLYSKETKKYFLQHTLAFLDRHVAKIISVFNKSNQNKDQELSAKSFFYEIVETCLAQHDRGLQSLAIDVIVRVLCCLLTDTRVLKFRDRSSKTGDVMFEDDFSDMMAFFRIFEYFGSDGREQQFIVLKKTLQKVMEFLMADSGDNRYKVNMKLLMLLQFIEQMFLHRQKELVGVKSFYEMMAIFMFVLQSQQVLTFDLPDTNKKYFEKHKKRDKKEKSLKASGTRPSTLFQSKEQQQRLGTGLGVESKAKTGKHTSTRDDKKTQQALDMMTLHPYLATLTSKQHDDPEGRDLRVSQRLKVMTRTEKTVKSFKPACWHSAPIFVSGGPVRVLLHIILKNINDQAINLENFELNIALLRYLLFNEMSEDFSQIINQDLGDFTPVGQACHSNDHIQLKSMDYKRRDTKDSINDLSNMLLRASTVEVGDQNTQNRFNLISKAHMVKQRRDKRKPIEDPDVDEVLKHSANLMNCMKNTVTLYTPTMQRSQDARGASPSQRPHTSPARQVASHKARSDNGGSKQQHGTNLTPPEKPPQNPDKLPKHLEQSELETISKNVSMMDKGQDPGFTMIDGMLLFMLIGEIFEIIATTFETANSLPSIETQFRQNHSSHQAFVGDGEAKDSPALSSSSGSERSNSGNIDDLDIRACLNKGNVFAKTKMLLNLLGEVIRVQVNQVVGDMSPIARPSGDKLSAFPSRASDNSANSGLSDFNLHGQKFQLPLNPRMRQNFQEYIQCCVDKETGEKDTEEEQIFFCDSKFTEREASTMYVMKSDPTEQEPLTFVDGFEEEKSTSTYVAAEIFSAMGLGGAPQNLQTPQLKHQQSMPAKPSHAKLSLGESGASKEQVILYGDSLSDKTLVTDHFQRRSMLEKQSEESEEQSQEGSGLRSTGIAVPTKKQKNIAESDLSPDSLVIEVYSTNEGDLSDHDFSSRKKEWITPLQQILTGQDDHVPHFGQESHQKLSQATVSSPKSSKQCSVDNQIRTFLSRLNKELTKLRDELSCVEQAKIIKTILKQTIVKSNQRSFTAAFANSTSTKFKSDIRLVAVNSRMVFTHLKKEIDGLKKAHTMLRSRRRPKKQSLALNNALGIIRSAENSEDEESGMNLMQSELIPSCQMQPMDFERQSARRISSGQGGMQRPGVLSANRPPPIARTQHQHTPNQVNQSLPVFGQHLLLPPNPGSPERTEYTELNLTNHSSTGPIQPETQDFAVITMMSLYAKKQYDRIIRRLENDEGTIWFDHLELEIQDFADIQKFYNMTYIDELPKPQQKLWLFKNHRHFQQEVLTAMKDEPSFLAYQKNYGKSVENPKKRKTMVRQRRTIDSWGRMMLVKPDRQYTKSLVYKYYDNFINDYIKKLFAVSMLHDEDFGDFNGPTGDKGNRGQEASPSRFEPRTNPITTIREDREEDAEDDSSGHNNNSNSDSGQEAQPMSMNFTSAAATAQEPSAFQIPGSASPRIQTCLSPNRDFSNFDITQPKQQVHYSPQLQQVREDLLNKMEKNRFLRRVLTDKTLGYRSPPFDQLAHSTNKEEQAYLENYTNKLAKKREHIMASLRDVDDALRYRSQMINPLGAMCGDIFINTQFFVFYASSLKLLDDSTSQKYTAEKYQTRMTKKLIVVKWTEVDEIFRRKFLNRYQAFDIITTEKKVHTFNLGLVENCSTFMEEVTKIHASQKYHFTIIKDPIETFKQRNHKDDWSIGVKTNQEFLLMVNKFSSRSFNDLAQYPIFPWVLQDYKSTWAVFQKKKDRNKTEIYRDLSVALNSITELKKRKAGQRYADRLEEIAEDEERVANGEEPEGCIEAPLYGTEAYQQKFGFSQKLHVINALARMEPFGSAYMFQTMKKENPDRNFYDFDKLWSDVVLTDPSYNCELVPEYYYMPEIYTNQNCMFHGVDEGAALNGDLPILTDTVVMPPWALNQFDLVRILRESLESKYVTETLGNWIDLIFGRHQANPDKCNLYCCVMYEKHHRGPEMQQETTPQQIQCMEDFYQVPAQLFTSEVVKEKAQQKQQTSEKSLTQIDTTQQQSQINRKDYKKQQLQGLILLFKDCGHDMQKRQLLEHIADHQKLNAETNIIHMILTISSQKCMVFLRDDSQQRSTLKEQVYEKQHAKMTGKDVTGETGRIMLYLNKQNLQCKDFDRSKGFDLGLRYEHVADRVQHIFQEFYDKKCSEGAHFLYAGGYLDNSVRIFDFAKGNKDNALVHKIYDHNARVTCLRFSEHYKYLYTCDEDGLINHYQCNCHFGDINDKQQLPDKESKPKNQSKKFPFDLIHTVHDQVMEIIAIDTNETLDMYCTISHDGTIAVRCQRTSRLWQHFSIFAKNEGQVQETAQQRAKNGGAKKGEKQRALIDKFSKIFTKVHFLKLSLHGYIIVCGEGVRGQSITSRDRFLYLVFSLNGDLLRQKAEQNHIRIKNIFLSNTEDCLIVASNHINKQKNIEYGNLEVVKLYGLERTTNLSPLVYSETINMLKQKDKKQIQIDRALMHSKESVPTIQAISLARLERNMNIFFVKKNLGVHRGNSAENKEIICFDVSKNQVWEALQDFGF